MPDVRSVALGSWVGIGARDEAPERSGASHFLEHLLFKGTATRSARDIAESIDEVGGDFNAFTSREHTAFEVRLLAEHLGLGLDVLGDVLWHPAFRADEVEAERSVILEEILMTRDEPEDLVHELIADALFPGHPVGRSILGTEATIEAMGRDAIAGFHAEHYRPAHVVVAAAGALHHDEVVEAVVRSTPDLPATPAPARSAPPAHVTRHVEKARTEQAHVIVGVRTSGALDDDRFVLEVVHQALGGGTSSRLFQEVREQRGLAYSVYSYRFAVSDCGALAAYAGTAPKNAKQVTALLHEAFDRLGSDTDGFTDRELAIAKGQIKGSTLLGLEDTGARMARLGRSQLVYGRVPPIDDVLDRIDAVTLDDVRRVGADLASAERAVAAIGPFKPADLP
jgi:predicted Zn-dependent peptidase